MELEKYLMNGSQSSMSISNSERKIQTQPYNGLHIEADSQYKLEKGDAKATKELNGTDARKCTIGNNQNSKRRNYTNGTTSGIDVDVSIKNKIDKEQSAKLLDNTDNKQPKTKRNSEDVTEKKKTKLIRWSILKDVRFLSFLLATICFTLPAGELFLPSLAKTRGVSRKLQISFY